jgi:Zn-dependent protease
MLPALPLDGGRILHALLWPRGHDELWASRVAADVGRFFGLLFVAAGVALFAAGDASAGLWLVITGWFLFSAAGGEVESAKRRRSGSAPSGGAAR